MGFEAQLAADSEPGVAGSSAGCYCGLSQAEVIELTGVPRAVLLQEVGSTMDVAHQAAAKGAPSGTLVLAERQLSGRGRGGKEWVSEPRAGIWLTLIERPREGVEVGLMSIRAGLALAPVLDRFARAPVALKWPNDLFVDGRKLGGILLEARWRDARADWVALGVGINLTPPGEMGEAAGLLDGVTAPGVLASIVPALRRAAASRGPLSPGELEAFAQRDLAAGKKCSEPAAGIVRGINDLGEVLVEVDGEVSAHRSGSLVLEAWR